MHVLIRSIAAACTLSSALATIWHVDASNRIASPNGKTWKEAFPDLQKALLETVPGDTIRIAEGTYFPGTSPEKTFLLAGEILLEGGYPAGGGTRDSEQHKTVFSGDYSGSIPDNNGDGLPDGKPYGGASFYTDRLVTVEPAPGTTILDGIWFVAACPDGTGSLTPLGGAICCKSGGALEVRDCRFLNHSAEGHSSSSLGMVVCYLQGENDPSDVIFERCLFSSNGNDNQPYGSGTAGYFETPSVRLVDCEFYDNLGTFGAALYIRGNVSEGSPPRTTLARCQFRGNDAQNAGAAVYFQGSCDLEIVNSLFWGNHSGQHGFPYVHSGAIYLGCDGPARFTHNTFAYNTTGGDIHQSPSLGAAVGLSSQGQPTLFQGNLFYENIAANGFQPFHGSVGLLTGNHRVPQFIANHVTQEILEDADPDLPNHGYFQSDPFHPVEFVLPATLQTTTVQGKTRYEPLTAGDPHLTYPSALSTLWKANLLNDEWENIDASGNLRVLGYGPDPGAFEPAPPAGTLRITEVEIVGNRFLIYFDSDRPVFYEWGYELDALGPYPNSNQPTIFRGSPVDASGSFPRRFFRLRHVD
ncbi:hypothetical protein HNR46_003036 [Haloferula luteola]|uniref:Right handed beta helix domain-containing protein n=1 Tax=Haloferula luteola TaxID=595692 RepID=A0A840VDT1_9BACT|nr:right-handed parallel beta-helix repeat-containing protein [Haloferula luteola]MBB5352788.1 hypothetical protein [Haloferula luteola]